MWVGSNALWADVTGENSQSQSPYTALTAKLPAVRAVQGDCETVSPPPTIGASVLPAIYVAMYVRACINEGDNYKRNHAAAAQHYITIKAT